MSEALKIERPWNEVKERLKESNIELTDEDLQYTPGNEDALIDNLSKKIKKSKEETREWIESVSANKGRAS